MKIAININELTLKQNTGVKVYTREIVKALGRIDKENKYFLYVNCGDEALSRLYRDFNKFKNFKIKPSKSAFPFWTYTKLSQEIKKDQIDVLFMPIQTVPFFKKPKNMKIVVTVHDLAFLIFPDHFTRKDRFLLNFHTKRAVKMADKIIAPSEATKRDIIEFYGTTSPSSSLSGGEDTDNLPLSEGEDGSSPNLGGVGGGKILEEDKIEVIWHGVTPPSPPLSGGELRDSPSLSGEEHKDNFPLSGVTPPSPSLSGGEDKDSSPLSSEEENKDNFLLSERERATLSFRKGGVGGGKNSQFTIHNSQFNVNNPYILFVGSVQPRKNIIGLIEAFELLNTKYQIPNTKYQLIICGGRGWMADGIYKRAKKSKFSQDIIFIGNVSDKKRDELYKNALIFALPSLYEGFGLPVLEAMSYGVPCVISDNSSLSEIAGRSALLVDANNSDDIAKKINLLLSNSELRKDLSRRGIENARRFSWDKAAEKMVEMFNSIRY